MAGYEDEESSPSTVGSVHGSATTAVTRQEKGGHPSPSSPPFVAHLQHPHQSQFTKGGQAERTLIETNVLQRAGPLRVAKAAKAPGESTGRTRRYTMARQKQQHKLGEVPAGDNGCHVVATSIATSIDRRRTVKPCRRYHLDDRDRAAGQAGKRRCTTAHTVFSRFSSAAATLPIHSNHEHGFVHQASAVSDFFGRTREEQQ